MCMDTNFGQQMVLQAVETTTATMIMNLIKMSLVEEDKFAIVRGRVVYLNSLSMQYFVLAAFVEYCFLWLCLPFCLYFLLFVSV